MSYPLYRTQKTEASLWQTMITAQTHQEMRQMQHQRMQHQKTAIQAMLTTLTIQAMLTMLTMLTIQAMLTMQHRRIAKMVIQTAAILQTADN